MPLVSCTCTEKVLTTSQRLGQALTVNLISLGCLESIRLGHAREVYLYVEAETLSLETLIVFGFVQDWDPEMLR